jgi:hypothetical protein
MNARRKAIMKINGTKRNPIKWSSYIECVDEDSSNVSFAGR